MKCCNSLTYLSVLSSILLSYLAHSQSKPKKILKNPLPKKLLIFPEMELSSSNFKKIIFSQKKSSSISGNGTLHFLAQNRKIKKRCTPQKIKPSKKSLYFRKRNFLMFPERNIQNPYISPILQEVTFRAQKIKKMCFIVFLAPKKLNKTPQETPLGETGCLSNHQTLLFLFIFVTYVTPCRKRGHYSYLLHFPPNPYLGKQDFPRGGEYFNHVPLLTQLIYFQPKRYDLVGSIHVLGAATVYCTKRLSLVLNSLYW